MKPVPDGRATSPRVAVWLRTRLLAACSALLACFVSASSLDVPSEWQDWLRQNHQPIRSADPEDTDFSDLQFLKPVLAGKRLVQLGESGHGVAQFDSVKVRLIKFLHQQMGFDVIAFESGLYECFRAGEQVGTLPPQEVMRHSIFGVWHAQETLPLFTYLAESSRTSRPLLLAGFDTQVSSGLGVNDRPALFREVLSVVDPERAQRLFEADLQFHQMRSRGSSVLTSFLQTDGERLTAVYEDAVAIIDARRADLVRAFPGRPLLPLVVRQSAWSTPVFIQQLLAGLTQNGSNIRDEGMAINVDVLLDQLYPGRKVMVWAHNYHIQHDAGTVYSQATRTMGRWLRDRRGGEIYTMGLFMHQGTAAQNDRVIYALTPARSGGLEDLLFRTGEPFAFVDLLGHGRDRGSDWMFQRIPFKDWGRTDLTMVPRDQYDGILFILNVNPPRYL